MRDDFETASAMLEESAALFRELDEPGRLATALSNLATSPASAATTPGRSR
jgi:hypothetical protein